MIVPDSPTFSNESTRRSPTLQKPLELEILLLIPLLLFIFSEVIYNKNLQLPFTDVTCRVALFVTSTCKI